MHKIIGTYISVWLAFFSLEKTLAVQFIISTVEISLFSDQSRSLICSTFVELERLSIYLHFKAKIMPLTHKPPSSSSSPNKPTLDPHDPKAVRWSESVTGGDSDSRKKQHGIHDDDEFEEGETPEQGDEENQHQLVIGSRTPEPPKNDMSWARFQTSQF